MSSVSPSSSASQGQAQLILSPPCVPDFSGLSVAPSAPLVIKIWEQYYEAYRAYVGSAGSGMASSSGSEVSERSGGSTTLSKSAARRARRARLAKSSVRSSDVQASVVVKEEIVSNVADRMVLRHEPGLCYLSIVRHLEQSEVVAELGKYPTVHDFLMLPAHRIISYTALLDYVLVEHGGDVYHVQQGDGVSVVQALVRVARSLDFTPYGSVAALAKTWPAVELAYPWPKFSLNSRLGAVVHTSGGFIVGQQFYPTWPSQLPKVSVLGQPTSKPAPVVAETIGGASGYVTVSRRVLTDRDRARIVQYATDHPELTQREVSQRFDLNRSTVSKILRSMPKRLQHPNARWVGFDLVIDSSEVESADFGVSLPFYSSMAINAEYEQAVPTMTIASSAAFSYCDSRWCIKTGAEFDVTVTLSAVESVCSRWSTSQLALRAYWVKVPLAGNFHPMDVQSIQQVTFPLTQSVDRITHAEREYNFELLFPPIASVDVSSERVHLAIELCVYRSDHQAWAVIMTMASVPLVVSSLFPKVKDMDFSAYMSVVSAEMDRFGSASDAKIPLVRADIFDNVAHDTQGKIMLRDIESGGMPGECYLRMIDYRHVAKVWEMLGPYPMFFDLMNLSSDMFVSRQQLDLLGVVSTSVEACHITTTGTNLTALLHMLALEMQTPLRGSLAEAAVDWIAPYDPALVQTLTTVVGDLTLREWMAETCGVAVSAIGLDYVNLLSKTAALHDAESKRRLKVYEAVGDASLTAALALKCSVESRTVQEYQEARSYITSNATLSRQYGLRVPDGFVTYPTGVNPSRGNVGAYFLEAYLGYVFQEFGRDSLIVACDNLGLIQLYPWS